eukprot:1150974-Pelagomonas_calceolata.AAC.5
MVGPTAGPPFKATYTYRPYIHLCACLGHAKCGFTFGTWRCSVWLRGCFAANLAEEGGAALRGDPSGRVCKPMQEVTTLRNRCIPWRPERIPGCRPA